MERRAAGGTQSAGLSGSRAAAGSLAVARRAGAGRVRVRLRGAAARAKGEAEGGARRAARRGAGPGAAAGLAVCLWAVGACAQPHWNASWLTGVCGTGTHRSYWQHTCWFNGLRGDMLFGRARDADFGVGPYADVTTSGFNDLKLGGGGTLLMPVSAYVPIAVSAGGYARHSGAGWEPGVSGWLFVGGRSHNFHGSYDLAGGLMVGMQYGLGRTHETAIVVAAQIDGLVLALPFILAYSWLRGPPNEQ